MKDKSYQDCLETDKDLTEDKEASKEEVDNLLEMPNQIEFD